ILAQIVPNAACSGTCAFLSDGFCALIPNADCPADSTCAPTDTGGTCPSDCPPAGTCGNGVCEAGEVGGVKCTTAGAQDYGNPGPTEVLPDNTNPDGSADCAGKCLAMFCGCGGCGKLANNMCGCVMSKDCPITSPGSGTPTSGGTCTPTKG